MKDIPKYWSLTLKLAPPSLEIRLSRRTVQINTHTHPSSVQPKITWQISIHTNLLTTTCLCMLSTSKSFAAHQPYEGRRKRSSSPPFYKNIPACSTHSNTDLPQASRQVVIYKPDLRGGLLPASRDIVRVAHGSLLLPSMGHCEGRITPAREEKSQD